MRLIFFSLLINVYLCSGIYINKIISVCIVYMGQRKNVSNGVTISCFLVNSNQREGANAAPWFVFCAAVNIRVSTLL